MTMQLKSIQKTIAFITKNGYETDHIEFLKSTAVFLGNLFGVNFVLIDKYTSKSPDTIETIALYENGGFKPNFVYKLANTPCETIINNKFCAYPSNVKNNFPKDDFLRQNNIESYIGKPLWNSKKEPLGLICFMDTKQKSEKEVTNIEMVLDIIAIKIEEVLEKLLFEAQLNLKIYELKIAKEKAEKSEQQLKEAQQIANLGHWELDIQNNKLFWSDEVYRIFKLRPQELEASEDLFMKLIHPDDIAKYQKVYAQALINKMPWEIKYRLIFRSGEIKHILGKGHIEFDEKGKPLFSIGTILDNTSQTIIQNELIKAKLAAEKNEEKFKKLSNLIFEGIAITENVGVILECNNIFLKMFGYSQKEIIGKNIIQLLFHEKYHEIIINNRKKLHTLPFEIEGTRKDGSVFPVEIEARNIDLGNSKVNRLITFRNLTSRKKSQIENKKLSIAIEQSANTVVITDIFGNIEYTNPKFTEITGYTAAEVFGKNPRVLKSGAQPKEFYENLWQTISGGNIWKGQIKNKTKKGKFYWEQVTITPIKDETGKNLSYLAIKEDITAKKEAEENLVRATEEIAKNEKKFRELYEKSGDAILIIKNGYFVDCNQATIDMLGYKDFEEVLNLQPSDISPIFQPDGSKSKEKFDEMLKITSQKGTHRLEWWHKKQDGKLFPVEVLLTAIENEPNKQTIHCVVRDITNRKLAEEQIQKQIDQYKLLSDDYLSQNAALMQLSNELSEKNRLLFESKDRFINLFEQNPVPLWEQDFSKVIKLLNDKNYAPKELKKYLDETPDFVNECITNIKILNANKAALKMFDLNNTDELKIHLGKTNNKKAIEVLKSELVSIGTNKKTFSAETELVGKNGSPILALIKSVIIDDHGTSIASVMDITVERKAANELAEQKLLFEKMFNAINDAIVITNTNREILMVNPNAKNILGYSPEELRGKSTEIFYADNSKFEKAGDKVFNEHSINNDENYITYYKTKENVIFPGETFGSKLFSNQGKWIGNIGVIRNISDRINFINEIQKAKEIAEKSEKSLNEAQKIAQLGSYDLDFTTGFYQNSLTFNDIFGIDESYDKTIPAWLNLIHPEDLNMMEEYFRINIIENKVDFKKEYRIIRYSDKQIRWVQGLGKLSLDNQGNLKNLIGTIQDISEKRQILEDLIISKEKAEESGRLKTEFIQNMSHEIRTPMNGILGFSELLDNPHLADEKRKLFIDIIKNSTHQLLHIIDDIMEISVLETKQIKAEENPVCLNDLLHELYAVFKIKASSKNVSLLLKNGLPNAESNILTDSNKLNKVLGNLLENALKFTDEGFVELGYKLKKASESAELEIYVKDSGIGIKPDKQKLIFDRFSQAEKDLSKKVGGLGLGLSIAKENSELLGGKITVVSELGEGAAFYVTIPYKPVNIIPEILEENSIQKKEKPTILIAEDEDVNFMVLEILLEDKLKFPCTILHAKNGLEAVELFKSTPDIDMVLMDIKMPKMDGLEATKRIKEYSPNVPIIAQTAYSTPEEKEKAFLAGCDDFLSKPIGKDALNSVICKFLLADRNNESTIIN